MRGSFVALAALLVATSAFVAEGCATSTENDPNGDDDAGQNAGDSGSEIIDGSPILSGDSGSKDAGSITDSGGGVVDSGSCTLTPPSNKCGIFPNCGCAGTTCDFVLDSGAAILPTACTPSVGSTVGGDVCSATTDCAQGLTCLYGLCHPFCGTVGADCGGIYSQCRVHDSTTGYDICGIKCDVSSAAGCPATFGCVAVPADVNATSECEPVGTKGQGAACATGLECKPGYNCIDTSSKMCLQTCKISGGTCITGTCTELATPLLVDGIEYGYCG